MANWMRLMGRPRHGTVETLAASRSAAHSEAHNPNLSRVMSGFKKGAPHPGSRFPGDRFASDPRVGSALARLPRVSAL